jgi:hypothetical protein
MCPETAPEGLSLKRDVSPVSDWGEMSQVWWGALLAAKMYHNPVQNANFMETTRKVVCTLSAAIFIDRHDLRMCSY